MERKILILEDESIIAYGIKMHLDKNNYSCDVALNPKHAEKLIHRYRYLGMICDINLKDEITGIDFVKTHIDERTPVVFLTAYSDFDTMKMAELASPFAYVIKPFDKDHLLITLNLAIANCKKKFLYNLSDNTNIEAIELSPREIEILHLLAQSKTTDEISVILNISSLTVATHRKNIFRKTGAKSLIELISLAVEKGWF